MVNVFTSWIGNPPEPREIDTKEDDPPLYPDVEGIRRISRKYTGNDVTFHFCCLKKYVGQYKKALPNMTIVPIEDQFYSAGMRLPKQTKPSPNLSADVDYIIRQTIGFQGDKQINTKFLAMVKDLWSIYCVWKFGGYHIDSGCFPGPEKIVFPECTTLGVVGATDDFLLNKDTYNYSVSTRSGIFPAVLFKRSADIFQHKAGLKFSQKTKAPLERMIDVWAIRGAAGEEATEVALRTYVNLWFAIQEQFVKNEDAYRDVLRHTVISACATGIAHKGSLDKESLMPGKLNGRVLEVPSIKKFGFKSHR